MRPPREIGKDVGAVGVVLVAGIAHLGAGRESLRTAQPDVEVLVGPVVGLMLGEIVAIGKARMARDRTADDAVEIGADLVGAVLGEVMAGAALFGGALTGLGVGLCKQSAHIRKRHRG